MDDRYARKRDEESSKNKSCKFVNVSDTGFVTYCPLSDFFYFLAVYYELSAKHAFHAFCLIYPEYMIK